jgi:hypothetical protein
MMALFNNLQAVILTGKDLGRDAAGRPESDGTEEELSFVSTSSFVLVIPDSRSTVVCLL